MTPRLSFDLPVRGQRSNDLDSLRKFVARLIWSGFTGVVIFRWVILLWQSILYEREIGRNPKWKINYYMKIKQTDDGLISISATGLQRVNRLRAQNNNTTVIIWYHDCSRYDNGSATIGRPLESTGAYKDRWCAASRSPLPRTPPISDRGHG